MMHVSDALTIQDDRTISYVFVVRRLNTMRFCRKM
jgi:hypothetical protein